MDAVFHLAFMEQLAILEKKVFNVKEISVIHLSKSLSKSVPVDDAVRMLAGVYGKVAV